MTDEPQPIVYEIWNEKYRARAPDGSPLEQSPEESMLRVAKGVYALDGADDLGTDDPEVLGSSKAGRALVHLVNRTWCPAGRIHAGAGTKKRVTLINCFVSPDIEDSMRTEGGGQSAGIMDALKDAALTQQMGGGIGMDFSTLRPRGAVVHRTGSVASGPLHFMDMWNAMSSTVVSSGSRRGAMMGTLRCDHPDLLEFVEAKQKRGRLTNFNISVLVTDKFMEAVRHDGDWDLGFSIPRADGNAVEILKRDGTPWYVYQRLKARPLWDKITQSTYEYAEPGVIFIDRINEWNNLEYCEYIHTTNPCFTGDTKVWTMFGPKTFAELVRSEQSIPVLTQLADGSIAYRDMTRPRLTRRNAKVVEVILRGSGRQRGSITTVRCTPNHVFFLRDGSACKASGLKTGMRIISAYRSKKVPYRISSDGAFKFEHYLVAEYKYGRWPDYPRECVHHKNEIRSDNNPDNIEIWDHGKHSSYHMRGDRNPMRRFPERNHFLTMDVSGINNGMYGKRHSSETRAKIGTKTAQRFRNEKFRAKHRRACLAAMIGRNHSVVAVRVVQERTDVYCGTVKATGKFFILSGEGEAVLVSNCGEQPLPANGDCNLGAVNLARMVRASFTEEANIDWPLLTDVVRVGVRFLDNVLDVTLYPTKAQEEEAKAKRRIGLGITGLGNLLQQMKLRYGSENAIQLTKRIMEVIRDEAYRTSVDLSRERSSFPLFRKEEYLDGRFIATLPQDIRDGIAEHGIRNGVLLTVAPTGTTSIYYDNVSSGLEPSYAWTYNRKVVRTDGEPKSFEDVEDYGYRLYCKKFGKPSKNEPLPDYMVTALELPVKEHLVMQAACQQYVDASISKTINCPEEMTLEEFRDVYSVAYDLGLKGCTTYRPSPTSLAIRGAVLSVGSEESQTPSVSISPRPEELKGTTYKVRWPALDHAHYVTINDYVVGDTRRPFEIFINSKSVKHHEWIIALTRTISAIFRRGGDVTFLIEELQQVHSEAGGHWIKGHYVPSLVSMIGDIVQRHFEKIGLIQVQEEDGEEMADNHTQWQGQLPAAEICPVCQAPALMHTSGCETCANCGYSNCG